MAGFEVGKSGSAILDKSMSIHRDSAVGLQGRIDWQVGGDVQGNRSD